MSAMWPRPGLFFDFDGVLVDSARLKTDLFDSFYAGRAPGLRERIRDYCTVHGGVTRELKFAHIQGAILREPLPGVAIDELCRRFAERVVDQVVAAPEIPGATRFLEQHGGDYSCFVVSGTPCGELQHILDRRGMARHFTAVAGAPESKPTAIRRLLKEYGLEARKAVFLGDSMTDLTAARETGLSFLGVGQDAARVLPVETEVLPDMTRLAEALAQRSACAGREKTV